MITHLRYLRYVVLHKWYVFVACCRLGIPWLGLIHDWSKLLPSEWFPYAAHFYGDYPEWAKMSAGKKSVYFGPTKESVAQNFDFAWLYHQHRNPHHWQFWVLREDDGGAKVLPMLDKYRREMLADWRGAGRAITGKDNTADWYVKNKHKMYLHPDTRAWIEVQLSVPSVKEAG
jgi:hypothetical protein